ncbi:hypothetical protein OUZ56_029471 [Daphnia magna]|uniref:Uncharacterized protein n=1 Tax=Daphnia magna TaxID=35525 RepID=A0ABR0B6X6_9CRUS|nr:hypothetical protein OUZ56_029471 [Daphnia magna]
MQKVWLAGSGWDEPIPIECGGIPAENRWGRPSDAVQQNESSAGPQEISLDPEAGASEWALGSETRELRRVSDGNTDQEDTSVDRLSDSFLVDERRGWSVEAVCP